MKKLWASSVLFVAGATLITGCSLANTTDPSPLNVTPTAMPSIAAYPEPTSAVDTALTITLLSGNALAVSTRQLFCSGAVAVKGTNFSGGNAACAAVEKSGNVFQSELKATDEKVCTDTKNQSVADVFGEVNGKHIRASFTRNNKCNVKNWDRVTPLIGPGA